MIVGFTGTRKGLKPPQRSRLHRAVVSLKFSECHHGCAVGADEEFALLVLTCRGPEVEIVGHPCNLEQYTSRKALLASTRLQPVLPPLVRNIKIVAFCTFLVACVAGPEGKGGTWSTIRLARRANRRVAIIWPDGTVTREGNVSV